MRLIVRLGTLLFLVSCASYNVRNYESIDLTDRTITVSPGGDLLLGELKDALNADGWRMVIYQGPTVTESASGEGKSVEQQFDTFKTRYRLIVNARQYDVCFTFEPALRYDISVIDNKNGTEALTLSGSACQSAIGKKFIEALHGEAK